MTYNVGDTFRRTVEGVGRQPNHNVDGRVHTVSRRQGNGRDVIDQDGVGHWAANIELVSAAPVVIHHAAQPAFVPYDLPQQITLDERRPTTDNPQGIRVGDRVRRSQNSGGGGEFDIGSEFTVSRVDYHSSRLCIWSEGHQLAGDYHYITNVSLVEQPTLAPATVEQVQEIVARANAQVPQQFNVGDRVRRKEGSRGDRGGNYDNGEPFNVDVVHPASHMGRETMCALDPDGRHHVFESLEAAPESADPVTMVPEGWATMDPWEQDLLNPFQVGDIVRRKIGAGDSDVDFTIRELGREGTRNQFPAARMTTTGNEWHHLVNLVLQRRPEPATVVTNTPTTEGTTMRFNNGDRVQRRAVNLHPDHSSPYLQTQLAWEVTEGDAYGCKDPVGTNHSWEYLELAPALHTPEEIEAGFYPGDKVSYSGTEYTVDHVERYSFPNQAGSELRLWFTTNTFLRSQYATLVSRGPNAPVAPVTAPAGPRVAGQHGFAVGDTVRTREGYTIPGSDGKRQNRNPWKVVSLDSDEWPVDENGTYYNPAHMEIVAEAAPVQEARIELNDPRVAWFWEAAAKAADEEGFCPEYERLARRLGVPGRVRKFTVTATPRGVMTGALSVEVEADNARDARGKAADLLGGPTVVENHFRLNVTEIDR